MNVANSAVLAKINATIGKEGGYANNPADKGGPTMWGITQVTARANGYTGAMQDMPRDTAVAIYADQFWNAPGFAGVDTIDSQLAERMFDWGVTSGTHTPVQYLQRILNVLNRQAKDYPDLSVDGRLGNLTIYALKQFIGKRGADGAKVIRGMMQAQQSNFYFGIAEKDPTQEEFEFGWQLNRALGT